MGKSPIVADPRNSVESTPLFINPIGVELVISSATTRRTFFIPSVDTKGWGRSSRVSRVQLTNHIKVQISSAAPIRTTWLDTPKCCIRTQIKQAPNTVLEPTYR